MGLIDLDDPESNESYLTMAELSGEDADDSGKLSSEESCSASDGDSEDGWSVQRGGKQTGGTKNSIFIFVCWSPNAHVSSSPAALPI